YILAGIGDVAHEQTVHDSGGAPGQQVDRGTGNLRSVASKHAVLNRHGLLIESLLLNRDSRAARARKVVTHFDILDGRTGTAKNLDSTTIGVEKEIPGHRSVRLHLFGLGPGHKVICTGNAEALEHRVR